MLRWRSREDPARDRSRPHSTARRRGREAPLGDAELLQQTPRRCVAGQLQEGDDVVGTIEVVSKALDLLDGEASVGPPGFGLVQAEAVLAETQGDGVRRRQAQSIGAQALAIGCEQA